MTNISTVVSARTCRVTIALAAAVGASACGASSGGDPDDVTVFAAASLTDAFTELAAAYDTAHPGGDVTLSFASSSSLAAQINEGAPADVYAAADTETMATVDGAEPRVFATNRLTIAVEAGNPLAISSLDDLADADVTVVLAAPEVPAGRYAAEILDRAGVDVTPKSWEADVRAVVGKVATGEADAGIVYATDVRAEGDDVASLEIPADVNAVAEYPITVTPEASNPEAAAAFVELVLSPEGQRIITSHGFGTP